MISRAKRIYSLLACGDKKAYWIAFAIVFCVMFACMSLPLALTGKSFIWRDDGLTQQYTSFILLGDWYRDLFRNFLIDHSFIVPMWTEIVGYGEDVVLSISSYIANPFFLTAAIANAHTAEFFLNISVFMTLLAAGITFTFTAKSYWTDGFAVLAGCMVFVFSGFTLIAFSQIHMVYPLALAPLVFLGADNVFRGKKPFLFVITLALMMLYSLNNGYMCCLLLVVFCLARFFTLSNRSAKRFFALLGKFVACVVLSICLASVLFLPCAESLLGQDRIGLSRDASFLYSLGFYLRIYEGLLKFDYAGSECFIGFFPIAFLALFYLFCTKKSRDDAFLIVTFCALSAVLLLPMLGSVFNGFAYPNNRWVWAYSLLIGIITVDALSRMVTASAPNINKNFAICTIIYCLIAAIYFVRAGKAFAIEVVVLLVLFAVLALKGGKSFAWKNSVIASLIVCCLVNYGVWLLPSFGNATERLVDAGRAYNEAVTDTANSIALQLPDDDARYDVVGTNSIWRNTGIATGHSSTSFYNSMYNNAIDEYHSTLGLTTSPMSISYDSMDSRLVMEQLNGVKYLVRGPDDEGTGSDAYDEIVAEFNAEGKQYAAYETDHVLPLAFVYDVSSTASPDSADTLNSVQLQDAMAENVLLDDGEYEELKESDEFCEILDYALTGEQLVPEPDEADGKTEIATKPALSYSNEEITEFERGGQLQVREGGAVLTLSCDIPGGKKAYLCMKGLDFEPTSLADSLPTTEAEQLGFFGKLKLAIKQAINGESSGCSVVASTAVTSRSIWQYSSNAHLYGGKDNWAFNLGESDVARDWVQVALAEPGFYSIESMQLVVEDEAAVFEAITERTEDSASDISFEWNTLECTATADDEGDVLFFRLPYSTGWHLKIDGQDAEIKRANIGFMATELALGEHKIELRYETPGLALGAALSLTSIIFLITWAILDAKRVIPWRRKDRSASHTPNA